MPKYTVYAQTVQEYSIEVEANDLQSAYDVAGAIDISDDQWQQLGFEFQLGFAELKESN